MKKHLGSALLGLVMSTSVCLAQDDLLNEGLPTRELTLATFKGTRIVNMHTMENPGKRSLEFVIQHRFGDVSQGAYQAFGIDGGATIRLGLQYSFDGRLAFGFGRSSYQKMFDGFVKYRVLRQTTDNHMPISLTWVSGIYYNGQKDSKFNDYGAAARISYCHQLLIARKFNERLSIQVAPTLVHYNLVDSLNDKNTGLVMAFMGRYKINKRTALTGEYGYRATRIFASAGYYDSFALGIDIETGGHVFQMHFTNSAGIAEPQFFAQTNTTWKNARTWGVRLGFNVSRLFHI